MITGFVGKPGSGKSLKLAQLAVNSLLHGHDVYTNFRLDWKALLHYSIRLELPHKWGIEPSRFTFAELSRRLGRWRVILSYADMCNVEEGDLFFDEAHIWLWSRAWTELPRDVISWWSQSRKHGVEVFWAAQRYASIDAHVRELTAVTWYCRQIGNSGVFVYQMEDMESQDKRRRIWKRQIYRLNPWVAACYDTREIMPPPYELTAAGKVVAKQGRPGTPGSSRRPAPGRRNGQKTQVPPAVEEWIRAARAGQVGGAAGG